MCPYLLTLSLPLLFSPPLFLTLFIIEHLPSTTFVRNFHHMQLCIKMLPKGSMAFCTISCPIAGQAATFTENANDAKLFPTTYFFSFFVFLFILLFFLRLLIFIDCWMVATLFIDWMTPTSHDNVEVVDGRYPRYCTNKTKTIRTTTTITIEKIYTWPIIRLLAATASSPIIYLRTLLLLIVYSSSISLFSPDTPITHLIISTIFSEENQRNKEKR